jgi:hypothetical protein
MCYIHPMLRLSLSALERIAARPLTCFLLIFVVSCAARFSLLALYRGSPPRIGEAENIGISLARTGRFADPFRVPTGPTAHTPPFYPVLVSQIYRAFGVTPAGDLARCSLNIVAYATLQASAPLLGAGLGIPRAAGLFAGLVMALCPLHKSAEVTGGWDEPYSAIAFAWILVWTKRLWDRAWRTRRSALRYGASWGLLFHAAPTTLPTYLGLGLAAWLAACERSRVRNWWLVSAAVTAVILIPWTLRNRYQLGAWMFMRSNLGLELQQSYNDLAQPTVLLNNLHGSTRTHPLNSIGACREIAVSGEVEFNRSRFRDALSWIRSHPGRFLGLTLAHVREFWFGWLEVPRWMTPVFIVITLLAWAGLWRLHCSGAAISARVIAVAWLTYPATYYFFQYVSRYRVVIDWSITLMAGYAAYELMRRLAAPAKTMEGAPALVHD